MRRSQGCKQILQHVVHEIYHEPVGLKEQQSFCMYSSNQEVRLWESSELVATVVTDNSMLLIQQRVDDVGFHHVDIIPLGGDRVFLHCSCHDDIMQVFNDAIDFFGMLFNNLHKWTLSNVLYERGA